MVAIKRLQYNRDHHDRYRTELSVLREMRKLRHPHLIVAIAAYAQGYDTYSFIFPWAKGGSLRDIWRFHAPSTKNPKPIITWIIEQLGGLFEGMADLHAIGYRHGDLKPEKILHFPDDDQSRNTVSGRLVIADVGLMRFRKISRHEWTPILTGTRRYEPPETEGEHAEGGITWSRHYDVWSMGCVLLECIIWLLYGTEEVSRLPLNLSRFWQTRIDNRYVHQQVEDWMRRMENDERCSSGTPMGELLKLMRERLLVVDTNQQEFGERDLKHRASMGEAKEIMSTIISKAHEYTYDPKLWEISRNATGLRPLQPQDGSLYSRESDSELENEMIASTLVMSLVLDVSVSPKHTWAPFSVMSQHTLMTLH